MAADLTLVCESSVRRAVLTRPREAFLSDGPQHVLHVRALRFEQSLWPGAPTEAPQRTLATQWLDSSRRPSLDLPADGAVGCGTHRELTPPGIGIDSDDSTKYAAEMSLIAHAALEGHLRQGKP